MRLCPHPTHAQCSRTRPGRPSTSILRNSVWRGRRSFSQIPGTIYPTLPRASDITTATTLERLSRNIPVSPHLSTGRAGVPFEERAQNTRFSHLYGDLENPVYKLFLTIMLAVAIPQDRGRMSFSLRSCISLDHLRTRSAVSRSKPPPALCFQSRIHSLSSISTDQVRDHPVLQPCIFGDHLIPLSRRPSPRKMPTPSRAVSPGISLLVVFRPSGSMSISRGQHAFSLRQKHCLCLYARHNGDPLVRHFYSTPIGAVLPTAVP